MALLIWAFLCGSNLFSEDERPELLAEATISLPWAVEKLDPKVGGRFKSLLLASLSSTGSSLLRARSRVLSKIEKNVSVSLFEPANPLLPIPSFVLALPSKSPKGLMFELQNWVKRELEAQMGAEVPWLRFEPTHGRSGVLEAFVMAGRIWLIEKPWGCEVRLSNRSDFLTQKVTDFDGEGEVILREKIKFRLAKIIEVYGPWWERWKGSTLGAWGEFGKNWKSVDILSKGSGAGRSYEVNFVSEKAPSGLSLGLGETALMPKLSASPFLKGGVAFQLGQEATLVELLLKEVFGAEEEMKELLQVFLKHTQSCGLSQSTNFVAPVFALSIVDLVALKKDLKNWSEKGKGRYRVDPQAKEIHLQWEKTTLSFRELGGNLVFSPLRQVLFDEFSGLVPSKREEAFWLEVPLGGSVKQLYYTALRGSLLLSESWSGPVDTNLIPPYSQTGLKNHSWEGVFEVVFREKKSGGSLEFKMPYGLLGLASGLELQSSRMLYVLSWYKLSQQLERTLR